MARFQRDRTIKFSDLKTTETGTYNTSQSFKATAGAALSIGDVVYQSADGVVSVASSAAIATARGPLFVCMNNAASGGEVIVAIGPVNLEGYLDTAAAAYGDPVYLSTAGDMSLTAGTVPVQTGYVSFVGTTAADSKILFDAAYTIASTTVVSGVPSAFADGTAAAPSITFAADTDLGAYRPGANQVALAAGGVALLSFAAADSTFAAATDTAGSAVYLQAPDAGAAAAAARAGGLMDISAGDGSAGAAAVAAGAGGTFVAAAGDGGASSGTGAAGNGGDAAWRGGTGGAKTGTGAASGGDGGDSALVGGPGGDTASTTTGNGGAGGHSTLTAGDGGDVTGAGSTGNGGAGGNVQGTAGDGGATVGGTPGAAGVVSFTAGSGADLAVAVACAAGGAASIIAGDGGTNSGGASGQAGGAGGAGALTGGAGGNTDSTGAHAAGAGGTVTVTSGDGGNATAGTGNGGAGGDIDLVLGSGGSSVGGTAGAAGQIKVNGTAGIMHASFTWNPASLDSPFFVAVRDCRVLGIIAAVEVAGTDGGDVTGAIKKAASGTAITAGTALHTGTINLKGTAATNQTLSLSATSTDLDIAAGTRIGIDFTGTLTDATGTVTVLLNPA